MLLHESCTNSHVGGSGGGVLNKVLFAGSAVMCRRYAEEKARDATSHFLS